MFSTQGCSLKLCWNGAKPRQLYLCHMIHIAALVNKRGELCSGPNISINIIRTETLLLHLVSDRVFHPEILSALRKPLKTPQCVRAAPTPSRLQKQRQGGAVTFSLFSSHIRAFFESRAMVQSLLVWFRDGLAMSLLCGFLGFIVKLFYIRAFFGFIVKLLLLLLYCRIVNILCLARAFPLWIKVCCCCSSYFPVEFMLVFVFQHALNKMYN